MTAVTGQPLQSLTLTARQERCAYERAGWPAVQTNIFLRQGSRLRRVFFVGTALRGNHRDRLRRLATLPVGRRLPGRRGEGTG